MTVHEQIRFKQAFNKLAVAVRLPADQVDAAMQKIYWDGLNDLPIEAVEDAAKELAFATWFPKLGEWRSVAERARDARILTKALPSPDRDAWVSECGVCDDTGWEPLECSGTIQCGRKDPHAAHPYVVVCPCRSSNTTYARKKAYERDRIRGKHAASL